MMVHLCPAGSEGASYAMFTTVHNAALNLSSMLSTMLLGVWEVGKDVLEANSEECMDCSAMMDCSADSDKHALCSGESELYLPWEEGLVTNAYCQDCLGGNVTSCGDGQAGGLLNLCEAPGLGGFTKLTLFTTFLQLSGLLFVKLLPGTKEDLMALNKGSSSSKVGGSIFLMITFLSLFYSVIAGVLNIVTPGWSGES